MKKKGLVLMAVLAFSMTMAGCSKTPSLVKKSVDNNTVLVLQDGQVQSSVVEEFDKDYYKEDDLKSFMEEAIDEYKKKADDDSVELKSVEVEKKTAKAVMVFKTIKDYTAFNNSNMKVMTTAEALKDKEMPVTFKEADGNKEVTKELAMSDKKMMVLVAEEPEYSLMVDGKVKYISNGVQLNNNTVKAGKDGITIIVYEIE